MTQPVTDRTIGAYLETLGSSEPTPGGGSVAGVIGALGCSLGKMVIALTKPDSDEAMKALEPADRQLTALQMHFTELAALDEAAYGGYRETAAMPKSTPVEKAARRKQMQHALQTAASVPLETAESAIELAQLLIPVQRFGNPYLRSDAQIAMICATSCFEAARINVNVNLAMIRDDGWVTDASARLEKAANKLREEGRASVINFS